MYCMLANNLYCSPAKRNEPLFSLSFSQYVCYKPLESKLEWRVSSWDEEEKGEEKIFPACSALCVSTLLLNVREFAAVFFTGFDHPH